MSILRTAGAPKFDYPNKAASTAYVVNSVVSYNAAGEVIPATSASTTITGIVKREVTAAASDYASETPIAIDLNFSSDSEFEIDANGTVTQAMVGTLKDLLDAETLDIGATTIGHFKVVGLGSTATSARVRPNITIVNAE